VERLCVRAAASIARHARRRFARLVACAVDGTCQEESDGRCQMGPARLKTVYQASVSKTLTTEKFDAAFLSSETNCDVIDNFFVDNKWVSVRRAGLSALAG
jgi:hypothetical protein